MNVDLTATADEQIRVSDRVKRILERYQREGESCTDVLGRVLGGDEGNFDDGFGRRSDRAAERVRSQREQATEQRKARMCRLAASDDGDADA